MGPAFVLLLLLATGETFHHLILIWNVPIRRTLLPTVGLGNGQTGRLTVDSHDITVLLNTNETFVIYAQ